MIWGDHLEEVVVLHEDLEVLVRDDLERGLHVLRLGVGLRLRLGLG